MKKFLLALLFLSSCDVVYGQGTHTGPGGGGSPVPFAGVPSGSCAATQTAVDTTTGNYYSCNSTVWLKVGPGAAGSAAWSTVTAGTNAGQALLVGNGSTFGPTGTGTITATAAPFSGLTAGTVTAVGTFPGGDLFLGGINEQTSVSYTIVASDENKLITFANAGAVAVTLPQATTAGFTAGAYFPVFNEGPGTVTITPTTSTINDAATLVLTTGTGATIFSDGTNYSALIGGASSSGTVTSVAQTVPSGLAVAGSPITTSGTLAITWSVAAAGQIINSSAANTAGFTATPTLGVAGTTLGTLALTGNTSGTVTITPQAAAGTVTLTLPNASGTIADTATAPLVLSATTGALTCPTCATSSGGGTVTWATPTTGTATSIATFPGGDLFNGGIDAQSGTSYTVVAADENKLLTFNNASAVSVTLPQATGAGFTNGAFFNVFNRGAGAVTITPTTSTINGNSTVVLNQNQGALIVSDGTNYSAWVSSAPSGSGTVTSVGLQINAGSSSGIFAVTGSPVTTSGNLNYNLTGTSGGIPYFSSTSVLSSSGLLAANGPVIGGGAGTTPTSITPPTTPNGVPQYFIETPSGGVSTAETFALAGVPTNAQTGTSYTLVATDRASYLSFSNASAIAVTLPQAGSAGFGSNFVTKLNNIGAGAVTVTPTTSTIDGNATMVLNQGESAFIYSDNTNYFSARDSGQLTAGANITFTRSATGVSIAGQPGTVTSFSSGNLSPLFTTSVATATTTPALSFTLSNAAAGTFLGNNTSSSAAPSYITLSAINPQTATYQVLASDFSAYKTIAVASGTFTITLVASGSQPANGQYINVVNYGSGVVTIARSGQNINGAAANYTLNAGSASAPTSTTIESDGTNYFASIDEGTVGTVTSVAETVPSGLAVAGSPITSSGTLAVTWSVAAAGQVVNSSAANTAGFTATPTLGVAGTTLGTLALTGNTSGTVTLTPQAAAGTVTLTLPNTTGTIADGASAPLVLSATTGNLTCPTCATSSGGGTITWATPTTGTATSIATFPGGDLFLGGVDAQSGTSYTVVAADEEKLLTFNNASAVSVTLPQATGAGFVAGAVFNVFNRGAGAVTITPTTSTINGNATLVLNQNQGAMIESDGTNYSAWVSASPSGSGTVTSVAQTVPSGFAIGGSPITTSGTLAITYSVSGAGQVINSTGSNAAGFTATPTLGVAGTTLGTLALTGNTSGTVTLTPQAAAGTVTLTLPNTTGTIADGASAPLSLSATTGNITCATCVTSAASLTSNQAVNGSGTQSEATGFTDTAGTITSGHLACYTASNTIGNCTGTPSNNIIGVFNSSTTWIASGETTVTLDATVSVTFGDILCASSTVAGDSHDNGSTPCTNGEWVGIVKTTAASVSSATAFIALR
jgi:hypothetical protein